MPLVTAINLRREGRLDDLERAMREALSSLPELKINDWEVVLVPVLRPEGFHGGRERKVTVVIRPYDVGGAGWVSA
jgi:hypothetical protein